jgi:two-component system LytT family response regulator
MNIPIPCLLVDDEPAANHRMAAMLAVFPEVRITHAVCSLPAALESIAVDSPEVVFLDVEMAGRSGLELVPLLAKDIKLIFVTGHEDFAVRAFELRAFDYLLKPVSRKRLELTLERLTESRKPSPPEPVSWVDQAPAAERYLLPISCSGKDQWVAAEQIVWIEALQNYTRIQLKGGAVATLKRLLGEWETLLGGGYLRLDRSLLIRHGSLRSRKWESRDRTVLYFDGVPQALIVGRTAATRLKELEG